MKKTLFGVLLWSTVFTPVNSFTLLSPDGKGGDDDTNPIIVRIQNHYPCVNVFFIELYNYVIVRFLAFFDDAEIIIIKDGIEVACQSCQATEGTEIPIYLSYGSGEYCIQVKVDNSLIATSYVTVLDSSRKS